MGTIGIIETSSNDAGAKDCTTIEGEHLSLLLILKLEMLCQYCQLHISYY